MPLTTGEIIAITIALIAVIPGLVNFFGNRKLVNHQADGFAAQALKDYAEQVSGMRKELVEIYQKLAVAEADAKKWKTLYEDAVHKMEWATQYIDLLVAQIRKHEEPVLPPKQ